MTSSIFLLFCIVGSTNEDDYDDIFPNVKSTVKTEITDHGYWREYRVCYPPFNWSVPLGLDNKMLKLFWKQPENWRHFRDTNNTNHCGVVRMISNGKVALPYPVISNETHFINTDKKPRVKKNPTEDFMLVFTGHWGHYFQHFFDNIGPQIALAMDVLGEDPEMIPVVVDLSEHFKNVPKLWQRLGFSRIIYAEPAVKREVNSKVVTMIESCPRVHPHFFMRLREMLKLPVRKPTKIIWISRKLTNSYFPERFIWNEDEIVHKLKLMFGRRNVVVYDHANYTLDETIELFASAKCILGSHGGGMYNQFFAPKEAVIVEILPIKSNGMYHDQTSFYDVPTFSHMAVWSNSLLIGQKFWRYYEITGAANFYVKIDKFMQFLSKIPELMYHDEI